jgi:hypothetical protein
VRSNERSGAPLKGRDQAQAVWVDLAGLFGRAEGVAAGIVTDRPAAGGLSRWLLTADGAWVGVVTYLATLTDGTSIKYADQLVQARVLTPR